MLNAGDDQAEPEEEDKRLINQNFFIFLKKGNGALQKII